jgi:membrane complex biogenesis BtpA family protein
MAEIPPATVRKSIFGMVHLPPLPGTPFFEAGSLQRILDVAVQSARDLEAGGADGCLVQTVDRVYSTRDESDPARVAAMTLVVSNIVRATGGSFQVGVQMMRNALCASLAVAKVSGASFIRAGVLVGATLSEHGIVEADPLSVMEYRNKIDARGVRVIADVHTGQFRWPVAGKSPADVARGAQLVGADGVAVGHSDEAQLLDLLRSVRKAMALPLYLAGHTNHDNAQRLLAEADGAFVGNCLEKGGWGGPIDRERVASYVERVRKLER